jgi:hypothetical protein
VQSLRRPPPLTWLCGLFLGLSFLAVIPPAQAQQVFKTQSATIYYEDPASLREMEHRLRFSQANQFSQGYFYTQDPVQAALAPGLAAKIDGLLVKVSLLLNRRPRQAQGLNIFILKDGKQVRQRHLVFQPVQNGGPAWFGYGRMEAFYEPRSRTIFLSLEDLHAGIMAHELTHYVLCESFRVPPPAALQEDWARYVESSLN